MSRFSYSRIGLILAVVTVVITAATQDSFAQALGGRRNPRSGVFGIDSRAGDYDEQLRQKQTSQTKSQRRNQKITNMITQSAQDVDADLKMVLTLVNENKRPPAQLLTQADASIETCSKYLRKLSREIQCQQHLLNSWVNHFKGNAPTALSAAKSACTINPSNNDARISQAVMAIFADRRNMLPRPIRENNAMPGRKSPGDPMARGRGNVSPRGRGRKERSTPNPAQNQIINIQASSGNILKMDVDAIDARLIGGQIGQMQLNCMNSPSHSLTYSPGETLCMMLWRSEPASSASPAKTVSPVRTIRMADVKGLRGPSDANDVNSANRQMSRRDYTADRIDYDQAASYDRRPPMSPMSPMMSPERGSYRQDTRDGYGGSIANPIDIEMAGFASLFANYSGNPTVKFVAVNYDDLAMRQQVMKRILSNPWPFAHVMAMHPASGATGLSQLKFDTRRPVLVIADKAGSIRYAGPAMGFIAPMLLENLLGGQSQSAGTPPTKPAVNPWIQMLKGANPTAGRPDPTTGRPGTMATGEQKTAQRPDDDDDKTLDPDNMQALNLVTQAETFLGLGRYTSYKTCIKLCRRVIYDYPDTEYTDRARQILRKIPERFRRNVTKEELGL